MTAEQYAEQTYNRDYHHPHPGIKQMLADAFRAGAKSAYHKPECAHLSNEEARHQIYGAKSVCQWLTYRLEHSSKELYTRAEIMELIRKEGL